MVGEEPVEDGRARGIPCVARAAAERCEVLASLPLARGVESLNVATAAAVALYEALRQREEGPA